MMLKARDCCSIPLTANFSHMLARKGEEMASVAADAHESFSADSYARRATIEHGNVNAHAWREVAGVEPHNVKNWQIFEGELVSTSSKQQAVISEGEIAETMPIASIVLGDSGKTAIVDQSARSPAASPSRSLPRCVQPPSVV